MVSTLYPMKCYYCDEFTNAAEVGRVVNRDRRMDATYITILAKCQNCGGAVVLGRDTESEENRKVYGIWPSEYLQTGGRLPPEGWQSLVGFVPHEILREYEEARQCFKAGGYTASAVMVRRVLEGICDDLGIGRQSLAISLREAQERGCIDARLGDWAQTLRAVGNDGAHFTGSPIGETDAEESLALCEEILRYLYVTSANFERLRRLRAKD